MELSKPVSTVLIIMLIGFAFFIYFAPRGVPPVHGESLLERVVGFHYALDEGANYDVSWIYRWNPSKIESDFAKIRNNFPDANLLRIPIDWYEMNETMIVEHIGVVLNLAGKYGFKIMFVLFNGISGESLESLHPWLLLPQYWSDQESRLSNIVNAYKNDRRVYAWALGNELNVFQEVVQEWFAHFIPYLKSLDTDTPVTTSFYEFLVEEPQSVPASTTLGSASKLAGYGLDFIEYHYYAYSVSNVSRFADTLTSYCDVPIFISEFGVQGGLNVYDVDTNKRLLQDIIQEFEKRLNVIGLTYFLFADYSNLNFGFKSYSIWDVASGNPREEASVLNSCWGEFLRDKPYAYLKYIKSAGKTEKSIHNRLTEYPNYAGWMGWSNHTSYDVQNVLTANSKISSPVQLNFSNRGFEMGGEFWQFYPPCPSEYQCWTTVTYPVYQGSKALSVWADYSQTWPGLAVYLNGTEEEHSFIRIPSAPQINNFTALTVEFWFNASSLSGYPHLIEKGFPWEGSFYIYIHNATHQLVWAIYHGGSERNVMSIGEIEKNITYHVVATYDGQQMKLYLNSDFQGAFYYSAPYLANFGDLVIGCCYLYRTNFYNGTFDDLRIYNRVINETEIQHSYNGGCGEERPLNKTGLVAWYRFNGETYDISPYYYHNDALPSKVQWVEGIVPAHLDDNQVYQLFTVTPFQAYILSGKIWVSEAANGAYAFLQVSFTKGSYYDWVKWIDSEYVNVTTSGWIDVYVSGIAPANADHIQVSCRVRAMDPGGYVLAYFDNLELMRIAPVSYDGNSIALSWAKGWNQNITYHLKYSAAQLTQNVSFTENDVNKIWTFTCRIAVVQESAYDAGISDWKGVYIGLAFTNSTDLTNPNTKWISWMDDTYLSFSNDFTQLTVKAVPPADAKAVLMVIKVRLSSWGVLWFDDPHLYCEPMVAPVDYSVPASIRESYKLNLTVQSVSGVIGVGKLVTGCDVVSCTNCISFDNATFTFQIPNDSEQLTLTFTIGEGVFEVWLPITLFLGLGGVVMVAIAPVYIIDRVKSGNWDDAFTWGLLLLMIGIAFIIAWLWS